MLIPNSSRFSGGEFSSVGLKQKPQADVYLHTASSGPVKHVIICLFVVFFPLQAIRFNAHSDPESVKIYFFLNPLGQVWAQLKSI